MINRDFKQRLVTGKPLLGAQLRFGSPAIAEMFAAAGYDFVVIDTEHAAQSPPGVVAQMQGAAARGAASLVRLGKNDPDLIRLYLDLGAEGIVVPLIETAEEARLGANACRYPPQGTRGYGPSRAAAYGFDDGYRLRANDEVVFVPVIETTEAVENIDEILAVEGLDSYVVGEWDLSVSLGIPMEFEHPRFKQALAKVEQAAARCGKPRGWSMDLGDANGETFQQLTERGFTFLWVDGDEWMLQSLCQKVTGEFSKVRER